MLSAAPRPPSLRSAIPFLLLMLAWLPGLALACSGSLRIEVREAGVYALDHEQIGAAQPGLADCSGDELRLRVRGVEVPIRVQPGRDGGFGPGARIEWIGEPLHGRESWFNFYSPLNAYLLDAAPGARARMRELAAAAPTAPAAPLLRRRHLEPQNLLIRLDARTMQPGDEPDVWYWARLTHARAKPLSLNLNLSDLDRTVATKVIVGLRLRGMSNVRVEAGQAKPPDHVLELTIAGRSVGRLEWDGRDAVRRELELPKDMLQAGVNRLGLRVPSRPGLKDPSQPLVDDVMLDAIDLSYPIHGDLDVDLTTLEAAAPGAVRLRGEDRRLSIYTSDAGYLQAEPDREGRFSFGAATAGDRIHVVPNQHFRSPERLRAVAADNLREASPGYDYLMIGHHSLLEAVEPLAAFHRANGMRVAVLDVDDLYDQFNDGIVHPAAIRDLIAWGHAHWRLPPRYVLLVGTASFDIRGRETTEYNESQPNPRTGVGKIARPDTAELASVDGRAPDRNLVPTWQVPSQMGQSASDNVYVALDGEDYHPSIAIGRLPVVSAEDAAAVVKKTIDYASAPAPGSWRDQVVLIANESESFHLLSDQIAGELAQEGFSATRVYARAEEADNLAHQQELISSLDQGSLLVHFVGHGGRYIWRSGPPDFKKNHDLFTLDDVSRLDNGARLPMVLAMTCYSGSFDNPNSDTIGERFLREAGRGAVAVFAASWSNAPTPEYSQALMDELLVPGQPIGDAIVKAKGRIQNRTLVETYNLFGDPALVLNRPPNTIRMALERERWSERIAVALPAQNLDAVALRVQWMDAEGKLLRTDHYRDVDPRFSLPLALPAARHVSLYAYAPHNRWQAIGQLSLAKQRQKLSSAAAPSQNYGSSRVKTAAETADTLFDAGFDPGAELPAREIHPITEESEP